MILNVAASGGPGRFRLADLQMKEGYSAIRAATQTTRRNDLLGVGFVQNHTDARTRYVLFNPGLVDTGMQKTMNPPMRMMTRIFAKSVDAAIAPMVPLIDEPPSLPLTAFNQGKPIPISGAAFDPSDAEALRAATVAVTSRAG